MNETANTIRTYRDAIRAASAGPPGASRFRRLAMFAAASALALVAVAALLLGLFGAA